MAPVMTAAIVAGINNLATQLLHTRSLPHAQALQLGAEKNPSAIGRPAKSASTAAASAGH